MFPGSSTINQIEKIVTSITLPSTDDIKVRKNRLKGQFKQNTVLRENAIQLTALPLVKILVTQN